MRSFRLFLTACFLLLIGACCLHLLLGDAEAGIISITTLATARVDAGRLVGILQITNRGDDRAYRVRADAGVLGERFESPTQPKLGPGESYEFRFNQAVQTSQKGSYPMTVLVHFQDGNGYPFTALTCTTIFLGEKVDSGISSTAAPLTIKDHGVVRFKIENPGPHAKRVKATLLVPQELSSESPVPDLLLMPGDRKDLSLPIRNLSALYGATYPVFLAQEYEDAGMHFALITSAMVRIVGDGNWFKKTRWHWAGGMVLLIGLFSLRAVKSKIRRNLLTLRNQMR